jgi:hypothetical protein
MRSPLSCPHLHVAWRGDKRPEDPLALFSAYAVRLLGHGFRVQHIFVAAVLQVFVVTVLMAMLGRLRPSWRGWPQQQTMDQSWKSAIGRNQSTPSTAKYKCLRLPFAFLPPRREII